MDLDDPVCLCFRVSQRKLLAHIRVNHPRAASQLSECGGAGTGCGWCVPFLKRLFQTHALDVTAEEYAAGRRRYLDEGKGTPPRGGDERGA